MENPRHWRLRAQRYRLEGSSCPGCGRLLFPPRTLCPQCNLQPAGNTGKRGFGSSLPGRDADQLHIQYRITERITA